MEGTIAVPGGRVWFQRIGGGPGRPLLVVHGGPGLPHNYLAPPRRLSDEREVIFWDQLGCGNSACPSDVDLWTMNRSVAEMATVAEALALPAFTSSAIRGVGCWHSSTCSTRRLTPSV